MVECGKSFESMRREFSLTREDILPVLKELGLEDDQARGRAIPGVIDLFATYPTNRTSRSTVYMGIAKLFKNRSTCLSDQIGAVIVKDGRVISTGYNGAPTGRFHCTDVGICRKKLLGGTPKDRSIPGIEGSGYEKSRAVHAEQAAICHAAKHGIAILGADIYVTRKPCSLCERMIVNAGIENIYYLDGDTLKEMNVDEMC